MSDTLDVGEFIELTIDGEDGAFYVPTIYWDEIDAAFHQFVERNFDRVLSLTTLPGGDLLIAVSRLTAVSRSTSDARTKQRAINEAIKAEQGFTDD